MRMLMEIVVPVEKGNATVIDGSLPRVIKETMESLKPEAAYFYTATGKRTSIMVFDLKATSDIPKIAEPFFTTLHAEVRFFPVMNAEDLAAGLSKLPGR